MSFNIDEPPHDDWIRQISNDDEIDWTEEDDTFPEAEPPPE